MSSLYRLGRRVVHKLFAKRILPLDERLASKEQVFHAPPFTRELVAAIRLISPHLDFGTGKKYRLAWERDQNGSCWGEYEALAPLLTTLPQPEKILEIGPGLGRSAVFFSKKLSWKKSDFHLYESDGSTTKYTVLGPRFEDSFCGNIAMLRYVLEYNGIYNVTIFDAKEWKLRALPGPYDLLYSFYSIGFHWSLEHFLDDLLPLMHEKSIAIFTVPSKFVGFPRLEELSYRIIDWKVVWPKERWHKLLILSKGACLNPASHGPIAERHPSPNTALEATDHSVGARRARRTEPVGPRHAKRVERVGEQPPDCKDDRQWLRHTP